MHLVCLVDERARDCRKAPTLPTPTRLYVLSPLRRNNGQRIENCVLQALRGAHTTLSKRSADGDPPAGQGEEGTRRAGGEPQRQDRHTNGKEPPESSADSHHVIGNVVCIPSRHGDVFYFSALAGIVLCRPRLLPRTLRSPRNGSSFEGCGRERLPSSTTSSGTWWKRVAAFWARPWGTQNRRQKRQYKAGGTKPYIPLNFSCNSRRAYGGRTPQPKRPVKKCGSVSV